MSLHVSVDVAKTSDMLESAAAGPQSVTFEAGDEMAPLVLAVTNDSVDESHRSVLVSLVDTADASYLVGKANAATVLGRDDDGDLIELTLDPLDLAVEEGGLTATDLVATVVDDGTASDAEHLARLFGDE